MKRKIFIPNNKSISFLAVVVTLFISGSKCLSVHAAQGEKIKTESELHLGLSETAFNKIHDLMNLGSPDIQRTDVYFDLHEDGHFQLRRTMPAAKLRLQQRSNALVLQKSWIEEQNQHEDHGFTWLKSTRTSASVKQSLSGEMLERALFTVNLLRNVISQNSITQQQKNLLEDTWTNIAWPVLPAFDRIVKPQKVAFLPAAVVLKERWIISIPSLKGTTVILQVGRDSDTLGGGKPLSFEVESEFKSDAPHTEKEVLDAASHWLLSLGVLPLETSPRSSFDFFKRLESIYP